MSTPFRFKNADNTTVDFEDYYVRADYFRSGNLWTWGYNANGQLGDNTIAAKSSPVQTVTRGSNWQQLSVGRYQITAIKTDGTLWTWGINTSGSLGDNTIISRSSPIQTVAGGTNWKQVSCGYGITAAIKTDGTLWCWGSNSNGGVGDNTNVAKSSPVQTVAGGTNWKQVSCAVGNTAAIKTDGTLWVWGQNQYGQLGDNTTNVPKSSPVQTIAGGTDWKQVSFGSYYMAAIKTDGTLWTWGYNGGGNLGDNTMDSKSSPVQTVTGGTNWKQVSCGYSHMAAIKTDGTLWLWGRNSPLGQLGDLSTNNRSSPVQTFTFGTNWKQVSAGFNLTGAIKTDGTLWTWGGNAFGPLGNNTSVRRSFPAQTVAGGTNWKQVSGNCGLSSSFQHMAAIQYQDDYQ
jgi:alpha-tubulin suppressor-like RCC1 family protein